MRRHRAYKFTDKHHSIGGIRSSVAGLVSLIGTAGAVYWAFTAKGDAGNYVVFLAVLGIVCSCYGLFAGNKSFKEEECYYLFSRIGTGLNFLLVIFWIVVIGIGCLI